MLNQQKIQYELNALRASTSSDQAFDVVVTGERFNSSYAIWQQFKIVCHVVAKNKFAAIQTVANERVVAISRNVRNVQISDMANTVKKVIA